MGTNFTAKEKVLVHLLDHYGNDEGYSLPVEITQEGIADSLGLKQNTVSYAVRNLVKEDMLKEETRRIKNKKQKRKAYFLTDNGFEKAKKTKEDMSNSQVDVISNQKKRSMKVGEINAYFQTNYSLLEIIQKVEEEGYFEPEKKSKERCYGSYLPYMRSYEGRTHPKFTEFIDIWSEPSDLISIVGEDCSGRTTLLSKIAEHLENENNVFYFEVKEWQEPMHLWRSLSEFLENCGCHRLSSYLKSEETINKKERLAHLVKDIKNMKSVFLIDDLHKNSKISEIIAEMLSLNEEKFYWRFVITKGSEDSLSKIPPGKELNLSSKNFLSRSVIEFYDHTGDIETIDDILDHYITDEEFWALALLSTFRIPVEKEALSRIEPATPNMVKNLIKTPLIYKTIDKKVGLHDFIREKLQERLSISQRSRLHDIASEYYLEKPAMSGEFTIEKLYHLVFAARYDTFAKVLLKEWEEILAMGYCDSIIELFDEITDNEIISSLSHIKAEAYKKKRSYDKAKDSYLKSIDFNDDPELLAEARIGLASTLEERGDYDDAIAEYEIALNAANEISDKADREKLIGKVYFRIGSLLSERGDYTPAEDHLSKAIEILNEEEHSLLTTAYFVMAKIKKLKGDWDSSISYFESGLNHWEKIKETYQRVGGLEEIGSFYTILRELNSAEEYLKEAIETSERFGYRDLKASALLSLTECYLEKRLIEKAIETGEEAIDLLEDMENEGMEALAHTLLGNAYSLEDELKKAETHYNKSISIYQKTGSSYRLGLAYFSMAKLQERKGNKNGIAENYRKAILSFSGSGAKWMAEKVEKKMEGIPISI